MVNDIIFHIGDHKTGSTSIQLTLAKKAWKAEGEGASVLYPANVHHNALASTVFNPKHAKFRKKRFSELNKRLLASNDDYAVVSAEHFEFCDPVVLKRIIKNQLPKFADKIRLIAYVRPHADRLASTFAERVKIGGYYGTIEDMHVRFQKTGFLTYTPRFEKWREVFGDQFTLRPMIRNQLHKEDVVEDFFHYLLEGKPFTITGDTGANASLSIEELSIVHEIHKRIRKSNSKLFEQQQSFGWHFASILAEHSIEKGTKPQLYKALAKDVVRVYRKDAEQLDAAFFDGTPMTDALNGAVDKAVSRTQSLLAEDYCGTAELHRIHAFGDLLQRIMEADPQFFTYSMRPPEQREGMKVKPKRR